MPGLYSITTRSDGEALSASKYNSDHQNHVDNQTPAATDDHSANVAQMRTTTTPGTVGAESLATSLAGEIERLRYAVKEIKDTLNGSAVAQWYSPSIKVQAGGLATNSTSRTYNVGQASSLAIVSDSTEQDIGTLNITTSGGRVRVGATLTGYFTTTVGLGTITMRLYRGGSILMSKVISEQSATSVSGLPFDLHIPYIDNGATAATHTYKITAQTGGGSTPIAIWTGYILSLEEAS
jgi:hypothetical protein